MSSRLDLVPFMSVSFWLVIFNDSRFQEMTEIMANGKITNNQRNGENKR